MVINVILLFGNLPTCALTSRRLCKSCSEAAADILCFDNLPVLPVWRRNSCTGCSSLTCRGGTGSGLGKRVTVAPDGHASRIDWARIVRIKDGSASRPMLTLIR